MNVHLVETTFEDYLRSQMIQGIDFRIRVITRMDGKLVFYIHPLEKDGETLDFMVEGNKLECVTQKVLS